MAARVVGVDILLAMMMSVKMLQLWVTIINRNKMMMMVIIKLKEWN